MNVGAVSAANRGGAAKAMKMPDNRMAHVRAVQVRILSDGTWQEWFSIDKEFGRRYSRSYAKSSHYNTHPYKIGILDSIDPGQGLVPRFAKGGNAMSASPDGHWFYSGDSLIGSLAPCRLIAGPPAPCHSERSRLPRRSFARRLGGISN